MGPTMIENVAHMIQTHIFGMQIFILLNDCQRNMYWLKLIQCWNCNRLKFYPPFFLHNMQLFNGIFFRKNTQNRLSELFFYIIYYIQWPLFAYHHSHIAPVSWFHIRSSHSIHVSINFAVHFHNMAEWWSPLSTISHFHGRQLDVSPLIFSLVGSKVPIQKSMLIYRPFSNVEQWICTENIINNTPT